MNNDLCGIWSLDAGYLEDLSHDIQLRFNKEGSGAIITSSEKINFHWQLSAPGKMTVYITDAKGLRRRMGPFEFELTQRTLPRGTYVVLSFPSGSFVPFQRSVEYVKIGERF